MGIEKLTNDNFKENILDSNELILIDFSAEWCDACKMITPIVEEVAEVVSHSVKVFAVNVDEEADLVEKFQVRNIPTLVLIKNRKILDVTSGYRSKDQILKKIEQVSLQ